MIARSRVDIGSGANRDGGRSWERVRLTHVRYSLERLERGR
jgi:hypothetical protein